MTSRMDKGYQGLVLQCNISIQEPRVGSIFNTYQAELTGSTRFQSKALDLHR